MTHDLSPQQIHRFFLTASAPRDPDPISRGRSALKESRYGEAIAAFEEACAKEPDEKEPKELLFTTLRQVAISRHLIGLFLDRMGWSEDRYQGFSSNQRMPDPDVVDERLWELCRSVKEDDVSALVSNLVLQSDRLAQDGSVDIEDLIVNSSDSRCMAANYILLARMALKEGEYEVAKAHLEAATISPSRAVHQLLGRILYRLNEADPARDHCEAALIYPNVHMLPSARLFTNRDLWAGGFLNLGRYKDYSIYHCAEEYLAVPTWYDVVVGFRDGQITLYVNRIAPWLRLWLHQMLPERVVQFLQRVVHSRPLSRIVMGKVKIAEPIIKAPDLRTTLAEVNNRSVRPFTSRRAHRGRYSA